MMNATNQTAEIYPEAPLATRAPRLSDGAAIRELVHASGGLETNTTYAYLLLSHHFSDTCVVADAGGKLVGCVLGYRLPQEQSTLFLWQIGVAPEFRGRGVAKRLLRALSSRSRLADIQQVQLTIAPSNLASRRVFQSWAEEMGCSVERVGLFEQEVFGPAAHEEEDVLSIGPLNWNTKTS
jgi:L-2,4-diaminobutyric acid acetyltransferase